MIAWDNHIPLSCVQLDDDSYGCVLSSSKILIITKLEFREKVNGMCYFEWKLQTNDVVKFESNKVK